MGTQKCKKAGGRSKPSTTIAIKRKRDSPAGGKRAKNFSGGGPQRKKKGKGFLAIGFTRSKDSIEREKKKGKVRRKREVRSALEWEAWVRSAKGLENEKEKNDLSVKGQTDRAGRTRSQAYQSQYIGVRWCSKKHWGSGQLFGVQKGAWTGAEGEYRKEPQLRNLRSVSWRELEKKEGEKRR